MKAISAGLLIVIACMACSFVGANAATLQTFGPADVAGKAEGVGSLPSVILRDGTVCEIDKAHPSQCGALVKVPKKVMEAIGKGYGQFDGLFDLLDDGAPQVFINYWPDSTDPNCPKEYKESDGGCSVIALLVYRRSGNRYRPYSTLHAPTEGYEPGAFFLNESPRKAILQTRCGGSSGECLFYLDWHKHRLKPISDDYFLEGDPLFKDIDHDGRDEIFIPARGRDRTATQGAALLKWTGSTYRVWWPDWGPPPYVIYAQFADVDGDKDKEIIAVLDPGTDTADESNDRELGIWKLTASKWHLEAKTPLPSVADADSMAAFPTLDKINPEPHGIQIWFSNRDDSTFTCSYSNHRIGCSSAEHTSK